MKRAHKRIFGFFGLALVVAMTIFAASLPGPEAQATSAVTDTVQVRVVGSVPDVNVSMPKSGDIFTRPDQSIELTYENVKFLTVELIYTDKDGVQHSYTLVDQEDVDYNPGTWHYDLNLLGEGYGYGEYLLKVTGEGYGGKDADVEPIAFSFYPVNVQVVEDEDTGSIRVELDYDQYEEGDPESTGQVAGITVNVYDENGNPVSWSPITVTPPNTSVELPFDANNMPSGTYTIEVIAYDKDGNVIYEPFYTTVKYEAIPVPNTGGVLENLNISKTDYLITGLVIFSIVGVSGLYFVVKRNRADKRKH